MNITELCKRLGKSESTLLKNFTRTQINLAKKGIIIEKEGTGKNADYRLTYLEEDNKKG